MTALTEDPAASKTPAAAAQALRLKALERARIVIDYANRGVAIPEIAARIGMTESAARATLRDILARSMPESAEAFAAIQTSRLNEALLVAFSAMGEANLKAVDRVVGIVRALDRYAAVLAARPLTRTPALDRDAAPAALADARNRNPIVAEGPEKVESRSLDPTLVTEASGVIPAKARIQKAGGANSVAVDHQGPARGPAALDARIRGHDNDCSSARPEILPQPLEKARFGRGFSAAPGLAFDPPGLAARRWSGTAASVGALAAAGA